MVFYTTMTPLDQSKEVIDRFQKNTPEHYKDFEGLVKLYNSIFKLR
jgi:hypothetical protein